MPVGHGRAGRHVVCWSRVRAAFALPPQAPPAPLPEAPHLFPARGPGGAALLLKRHWFVAPARRPLLTATLAALDAAGLAPPLWRGPTHGGPRAVGATTWSLAHHLDAVPLRPVHLAEAGALVGRAHAAFAALPPALAGEDPRQVPAARRDRLLAPFPEAPIWRRVLAEAAEVAPSLPRQVVHRDLHPANLLATRDRLWLLDPDSAAVGHRVVDLLFAALRFGRGDRRAATAVVDGYGRVHPLSAEERRHGALLLAADLIGKVAFIADRLERGDPRFGADLARYRAFTAWALARHADQWPTAS